MARDIWVISDTHFDHANILTFTDKVGKPCRDCCTDVEVMNEQMIANWNSVVKPGDKVYHLGDVLFGTRKQEWMDTNFPRLNRTEAFDCWQPRQHQVSCRRRMVGQD